LLSETARKSHEKAVHPLSFGTQQKRKLSFPSSSKSSPFFGNLLIIRTLGWVSEKSEKNWSLFEEVYCI
jgi:hypothetical protein